MRKLTRLTKKRTWRGELGKCPAVLGAPPEDLNSVPRML